jgi:hypothetical protein
MIDQFVVATTIHPKTEGVRAFEKRRGWRVILVGDARSVHLPSSGPTTFLSLEAQMKLPFRLARKCPLNHYARKNIGYLYAIAEGARVIFDTDDDNVPLAHWKALPFTSELRARPPGRFVNIYRPFTSECVWPRGLPLDEILREGRASWTPQKGKRARIGIWQGLAEKQPDVDALYGLTSNKTVRFARKPAFHLAKGRFCPVNSQCSFWGPHAFPYLYLPSTVSFRFSDILRGYIAQRLLWRDGRRVGITPPAVRHCRNAHDPMRDFADELPMYLHTKAIVAGIQAVKLGADPWGNLFRVYESLAAGSFVAGGELELLGLWRAAFHRMKRATSWTKPSF